MTKQAKIDELENILDERDATIDELRTQILELENNKTANHFHDHYQHLLKDFRKFRDKIISEIRHRDTNETRILRNLVDNIHSMCVNYREEDYYAGRKLRDLNLQLRPLTPQDISGSMKPYHDFLPIDYLDMMKPLKQSKVSYNDLQDTIAAFHKSLKDHEEKNAKAKAEN